MRRVLHRAGEFAARSLLLLVFVAEAFWFPPGVRGAEIDDLVGRTVTGIQLRSDVADLDLERLSPLLLVEVGEPLSREALARSLRNLQASGLVSEVEVFVDPVEGGVAVTFATWGRVQVESIRFEGELVVKEKDLQAVLTQHEAEPLVSSRIVRGVYDLESFYQRMGYLEASARSRPQVDLENKTASLTYLIDPGPRFTIQSVGFEGSFAPFTAVQLQDRLRMVPGKPFRERRARADVERLESWLFGENHRRATVGPYASLIDWDNATVDLVYQIDVGPRFHFEIHGADERRLRKKGLLPFLGNQRYDEAILLQSIGKIEDHYQRQGCYDVAVDWTETQSDELIHLAMTVDPGVKYELANISFSGNQAVPTYQLMSLISTESKRLFASTSGKLSDATIEDDIDNILSYYRLQGYWDAEVGPPEVTVIEGTVTSGAETEGKETVGTLSVMIPVDEGLQRRLVNLEFDGLEAIEDEELRSRLPLRAGGPFHPVLLDEAISAIRAIYRARGFESTQLSSTLDWNKEETLADLEFRIIEGPRSVVDRVVIRGNQRTRSKSIRDALDLRSGEYISTNRLLEAQNNLYKLGAFSSATVKRAPGTPFKGERDILVEVEEGSRHTFTYGFGLDTEDGFTGLFGYTRANMFGRGVSGRVDLRGGRDSLARLLLYQPFLGRRRITTTGSLFYIEETRDTFESLRRGGQLEFQRIGKNSRTGVLFDYRLVDLIVDEPLDTGGEPMPPEPEMPIVTDDPPLDVEIDLDLREVQIASLTPSWLLDHRNSPVNPSAGWSTNLLVQYAFPLFNAEEHFLKSFLQYTQFFDIGWLGSFGGSFRVGAIEPLDKTKADTLPDFGENIQDSFYVAISERYFAGGSNTHRAYNRDKLGICGETLIPDGPNEIPIEERCENATEDTEYSAIGGTGQLLLNIDYRFPIAGPIMGNVFVDTGNVWSSWRNINLSEIKTGVGLGIRYLSPVGPIRLEAGWNLDRLPGEDSYVIFFSVGNAY